MPISFSFKMQAGWGSLHLAGKNDCSEVVDILLAKGINTKLKANAGWAALHVVPKLFHTYTFSLSLSVGLESKLSFVLFCFLIVDGAAELNEVGSCNDGAWM